MPWARRSGNAAKYRTRRHRVERARWAALLRKAGAMPCAQSVCVMPTRAIHHGQPWHLGHAADGVTYLGPVHPACNVKDGARRGRARQNVTGMRW
jgi:hypothetical protein